MAWFDHPKSVQVCQDRCINGLDQGKPVIPTQKAYWTRTMWSLRSTLQGLTHTQIWMYSSWTNFSKLKPFPFVYYHEDFSFHVYVVHWMYTDMLNFFFFLFKTFLPYSRKRSLFGHVVTKSRKAWQTMELYPTKISEVHQTHSDHMISIWACRECLGHPISKKNGGKISFFDGVIPKTRFLTTIWLQCWCWLIDRTSKWLQISWIQGMVDW